MPALVTVPHDNKPAVDARARRAPARTNATVDARARRATALTNGAGAPRRERDGICPLS